MTIEESRALYRAARFCDTNNDDECDVQDILGVSNKIFGAEAFCARYPAP